jgi:cytochrome c2
VNCEKKKLKEYCVDGTKMKINGIKKDFQILESLSLLNYYKEYNYS